MPCVCVCSDVLEKTMGDQTTVNVCLFVLNVLHAAHSFDGKL